MDITIKKLVDNIELLETKKFEILCKHNELEDEERYLDENIHDDYRNLYALIFDATYEDAEKLALLNGIDYLIDLVEENLKC